MLSASQNTMTSLVPQDLEAEDAVLGALLVSPTAIAYAREALDPQAFYMGYNQRIYRACLDLNAKDEPVDMMTLSRLLEDRGQLEGVGGNEKIVAIAELGWISSVNLPSHVARVKDKHLRRQLWQVSQEIAQGALSPLEETQKLIADSQAKIFAIHQQANSDQAGTEKLCEVLIRSHQELEESNAGDGATYKFIPTGLKTIDENIHGLPLGSVTVGAGRPGMGKSTIGIEIALRAAVGGIPTMFFSLEMSKEQIGTKILGRMSAPDIPLSALLGRNAMPQDGWEHIFKALEKSSDLDFWLNDSATTTPLNIKAELQALIAQHGQVGLVVIDYLGLMTPTRPTGNEVTDIDQVLRDLRCIAKEFNCAILCLAQINRGVEARNDKRPTRSDCRGSGAIEQEAALLLGLYNDAYYNPDTPDKGIAEVLILKNRFGAEGQSLRLLYEPEFGRFRDRPTAAMLPTRGNDLIARATPQRSLQEHPDAARQCRIAERWAEVSLEDDPDF